MLQNGVRCFKNQIM